jgi:peptidoglycan DL-endopeptidase LytE
VFRTLLCALLLCPGAALAAGSSALSSPSLTPAPPGLSITVQPKDTAYSLARRHNLSVDALLSLNNLQSPNLFVGQVLLVSPPTYIVVRGDTAFSVAKRHNLSVDALLSLNHLSSPNLSVGQVLNLNAAGSAPSSVPAATITSIAVTTSSATISSATINSVTTSPAPLTEPTLANPMPPSATISTITVTPEPTTAAVPLPDPLTPLGSPISSPISGEVTPEPTEPTTVLPGDPQDWLANAQSLLGVPYVWGGKSRRGTDCSGFVLQVFTPLGVSLPRSSAQQAQVGLPVERAQLQSGDLVFFDTEGRGRVTHVGIALSATTFINANSYVGKVAIDDLSSRYWATRYLGARRILGVMASR